MKRGNYLRNSGNMLKKGDDGHLLREEVLWGFIWWGERI
jgi:hypothetical protein